MARIKATYIKTKIRGSIVEPVVAVIILVIAMAMAFTILSKTNIAPLIQAKNRAAEIISEELINTLEFRDFLDKEEQYGAFRLEKEVKSLQEDNAIFINLSVFDMNDKELLKKQYIYSLSSIDIFEKENNE